MMICIDKATAVRMYDKVQALWKKQLADLQKQLKTATGDARDVLNEKIRVMENVDLLWLVTNNEATGVQTNNPQPVRMNCG